MIALQIRITTLNNSDWLAYLGGKYYDYPNGKAQFHYKLNEHHDGTEAMLKYVLNIAQKNGVIDAPEKWRESPDTTYDSIK